jgi:hypothetical protein
MKLRIKGDSIRLRLTQGEVRRFADAGEVEERTHFAPGAALVYRLKRDAGARALIAAFTAGAIEVRVPPSLAREWCETDRVTLTEQQSLGAASDLTITVEKDYACLAPRENEDESDHFPNPDADTGKKC